MASNNTEQKRPLQLNVLLIWDKSRVKETRAALTAAGYYDHSRRISRGVERGGECFALPITATAVEELLTRATESSQRSHTLEKYGTSTTASTSTISQYHTQTNSSPMVRVIFSGSEYTLAHAELPPSKSAVASAKTVSKTLKISLEQLLKWLEPTVAREAIESLISDVPTSWERHGDLVVLPSRAFASEKWRKIVPKLPDFWSTVAEALDCERLARDAEISGNKFRSSRAVLLRGCDPWVEHVDNGIKYVFDVTKIMFSSGNITEKIRVAQFDCRGEVVVDMYAGIGYFTLPYLVHARADIVHACEWNPVAVEGLRRGLAANGVSERCVIHEGDCTIVCPRGIADRVNLGLIPSSEGGWGTACAALTPDRGGWLHIHGNLSWRTGNCGVAQNPWELGELREGVEEGQCDLCELRKGVEEEKKKRELGIERCDGVALERREKAKLNWCEYVVERIGALLSGEHPLCDGRRWRVRVGSVVTVKSYAPCVDHIVVDIECRPNSSME